MLTRTLDAYLANFSAEAPTANAPQSGLVALGVGVAQEILNLLGSKLTPDGSYGPASRNAWQQAAIKRRLNPAFDRRNKNEAWVHPKTYESLAAEAYAKPAPKAAAPKAAAKAAAKAAPKAAPKAPAPAKAAAKPAAATPRPPAPGMTDASVGELQAILYGLGWTTKKLKNDKTYGPQTANAWASSAKLRKLDPSISRLDGKTARVALGTYSALKSAKPATAATVAAAAATPAVVAKPAAAAPAPAPAPSAPAGTVDVSVGDLQAILYGLGWTSKKLKNDKTYGPQTANAWASSAKLRKLDPKISRVDGKTARVSSATYTALGNAQPVGAPAAPAAPPVPAAAPALTPMTPTTAATTPSGTVDASVGDLQAILYTLGWTTKKLKNDKTYGPQTANAWASSAKLRKLDPKISRLDGKTARVSATTYAALSSAQPATPATVAAAAGVAPATAAAVMQAQAGPPAPLGPAEQAILNAATAPVLVSDVQKMLVASKKYPAVQVTGTMDAATQAAMLDALIQTPELRTSFGYVMPQLLLQGGTSVRLLPDQAKVVALGASIYTTQQQAAAAAAPAAGSSLVTQPTGPLLLPPPPTELAPAPSTTMGPGPSTFIPAPSDAGMPYAAGGGAPSAPGAPLPSDGAPPPADGGAAAPPGADAWGTLVQALGSIVDAGKSYAAALAAAQQRGALHPDVQAAAAGWVASAEALKQDAAKVISGSTPLKSAIEASGPGAGLAGFHALDAMFSGFGNFGAVVDTVLDALKAPLSLAGGAQTAGGGVQGFAQLPQAIELIWGKLIQLLGTRAVTVAGAAAVAASGVNDVINSDVQAYQAQNEKLAKMVADGKLTTDEYNALAAKPPGSGGSNVGWLIGGAVGLGALAIYLRSRKKAA